MERENSAAVCLCIGTVFLCRHQNNVHFCSDFPLLLLVFRRICMKQAPFSDDRLIKYSSSGDERVFLLPLERCLIYGDLSEGVMQATSAMFVINNPWGYVKVGFCHPPTEKITFKFEQDRNHHEIAASLHALFRIVASIVSKIAANIVTTIASVNRPLKCTGLTSRV